ncbi:clarin-3 [Lepisosteus oculatus]|nr:PREDICTED: clarin-3 [Lepisosteus oculatus]
MPSRRKTICFLSGALASTVCFSIVCYTLSSTEWVSSEMDCSGINSNSTNPNGTSSASITYGLFTAKGLLSFCPIFGSSLENVQVLEALEKQKGVPHILHCMVVSFLIISLISTAGSFIITMYNSVSNPYETYLGPLGLYTCSSISGILIFLALILFVVNVEVQNVSAAIIIGIRNEISLYNIRNNLNFPFYLLIPAFLSSLCAIVIIFVYAHASYTEKKKQERPTEEAPKEVMMY